MYTSPLTEKIKRLRADSQASSSLNMSLQSTPSGVKRTSSHMEAYEYTPTTNTSMNHYSHLSTPEKVDILKAKTEASRVNNQLNLLQIEFENEKKKNWILIESLKTQLSELIKERRILIENENELKKQLIEKEEPCKDHRLALALEQKSKECNELELKLTKLKREYHQAVLSRDTPDTQPNVNSPMVVIDSDTEPSVVKGKDIEQTIDDLMNRSIQLQEYANRILDLTAQNSKLKSENDHFKRINTNRLIVEERMRSLDRQAQEMEALRERCAALELQLSSSKQLDPSVIEEYKQQISVLQVELEQANVTIASFEAKKHDLQTDNAQLQVKCNHLLSENEQLKDDLSKARKSIELVNMECDALKAQLDIK